MAACRRFLNVSKRNKHLLYTSPKFYSTSVDVKPVTDKNKEIVVPYRIHRGPTDILKALASTVSKDYTAPQYKYEDDPYFIPSNNVSKRAFALSKESGKKAARYILERNPELFLNNKSVPHIKAFDPPIVYSEENVTSPDVLLECLKNFEVNNSLTVYKILKEKGFTISQEVKQELLEILCFYNGLQPPDEDYYEERYFQRWNLHEKKWNVKGEAERLFDEMEKDSKAYSALIAGAAKFQDGERTFRLYDEMKSKGLIPTVQAFNSIIASIPLLREERESVCEQAMFLLQTMQKEGVMPDLFTMNAVLEVLFRRRFRKSGDLAMSLLAEMKSLNIEPSLGTYSTVLNMFITENICKLGALYEVISKIEGREWTIRHPSDVSFFMNAMEKCNKYAQDKDLAYRINNTVEYKNNCKLLGNSLSESIYFKNFLRLLCEHEEFEKFMEIYVQYVPNTYTPEPSLMLNVLQNLQFTGHYKYLPKLCEDVYVFEQTERENILSVILEVAGTTIHEKKVQAELVNIIWKIVEKINMRLKSGRFNFNWCGTDLGNALRTFINGRDLEKSWLVMNQLANNETTILGPPSKESLLNFCELFLKEKDYEKVQFCIKYATKEAFPEFGNDFKKLTEKMFETEQLERRQRFAVDSILQTISFNNEESSKESSSDSSSSNSSSSDSSSDEDEK